MTNYGAQSNGHESSRKLGAPRGLPDCIERPPQGDGIVTRRPLAYLDNPDTVEALAYGYGIPPTPVLAELRSRWWRLRAQGVHLPAERRIIVHHRVRL